MCACPTSCRRAFDTSTRFREATMRPSGNTGTTVPGWIRDEISRLEAAWPLWVLSAGLAGVMAVSLLLLGVLWTSGPVVCYARP